MNDVRELVNKLTLKEKAALCTGADNWHTLGIDRLEIPAIRMSDGPHGLRLECMGEDGVRTTTQSVSFPSECALAASFDRDVVRRVGEALGDICQAENVQVLLGPGVNIKRSPLCGRNFEYMSEDPLLAGELGAAYVEGVQSKGVGTSLKHYMANNQETRRTTISSELDERTMREIYLPAFERVIKKAKPWTVMSSYNKINGTFSSENRETLSDILRKEWGFKGTVVSDWGAVHDRVKAVAAGNDLAMPGELQTSVQIEEAVKSGEMPEFLLDEACENIIRLALKADAMKRGGTVDWEQAHKVSRMAAEESAVLLKNEDNILPIHKKKKIAFLGEFVEKPRFQGGGSSCVRVRNNIDLMEAVSDRADVTYWKGYEGVQTNEMLLAEAVAGAQEVDVAVVFAGLPLSMESEGCDRAGIQMPESHVTLIEAVAAVQPNVVVVLMNGSPIEMIWEKKVKGILEMYLGGEGTAEACISLLFGEKNPSGRLPETFPLRLQDNPSYLFYPGDKKRVCYQEGVYVGYRYYETKEMPVLYPFGHGLSYTTFAYDNLKIDKNKLEAGETIKVSVDVTNTGTVQGKEVVQLYVKVNECEVLRPVKELRGFDKVSLKPGETKTVKFILDSRDFSYWNDDVHAFHMEAGKFEIQIGASAKKVLLSVPVETVREQIQEDIMYSMTTLVGDMVNHPIGAKFYESHLDDIVDGVIKSGILGDVMGSDAVEISREQMKAMGKGMYSQSISTLKMFLPNLTDNDWVELLNQLNNL